MIALSVIFALLAIGSTYGTNTSEDVSENIDQFSINFLKELNIQTDNVVYSPVSVVAALGMILKGARGSTEKEILNVLNARNSTTLDGIHQRLKEIIVAEEAKTRSNLSLEFSNLAVLSNAFPFKQEYLDFLRDNYHALFKWDDFQTHSLRITDEINEYVSNKTYGSIRKVFDTPLAPSTKLVIVNTLYFKGQFVNSFPESETRKRVFYNFDKSESQVDTMSIKASFDYATDEQSTVLKLQYEGDVSMLVFIPKERYGLQSVLQGLSQPKLNAAYGSLKTRECILRFPKFKFAHQPDFRKVLEKLGIVKAFSDSQSDLSGISAGQRLYISRAAHKAVIRVDETATEAAALTAFEVEPKRFRWRPETVILEVNHPFAFVIRDNVHKVNLFVGVVNKL